MRKLDRSLYAGQGFGRQETYYGAYDRLQKNKNPQFLCPNPMRDLFTVTNNKGNKASTYKVGLITADEVAYAGGVYYNDSNYYLRIGVHYWTMSPTLFQPVNSFTGNYRVGFSGFFDYTLVSSDDVSVRPVINLIPTIEITSITQDIKIF